MLSASPGEMGSTEFPGPMGTRHLSQAMQFKLMYITKTLSQTICIYKMSNSYLQFVSVLPVLIIGCLISNAFLREFLDINTAILQMRNLVTGRLCNVV